MVITNLSFLVFIAKTRDEEVGVSPLENIFIHYSSFDKFVPFFILIKFLIIIDDLIQILFESIYILPTKQFLIQCFILIHFPHMACGVGQVAFQAFYLRATVSLTS